MAVFSPWALGTTQLWAVWTMNIAGYLLGTLLLMKFWIRGVAGYPAARWDFGERESGKAPGRAASKITVALAAFSVLVVGYCLISAANARAVFHPRDLSFEYFEPVKWLPHSLDAHRSWRAFWTYLGLAWAFWSVRDWLLGKSETESRVHTHSREGEAGPAFPARLRRLLWLLAISGGLLALEGIAQRIEGSGRILFIWKATVNKEAETQFGPYAYRSNAAQYFNLLWPVCVGFWWTLQRTSVRRDRAHHILLGCAALMAACPIISTSRGGALITIGIAALATVLLPVSHFLFGDYLRRRSRRRSSAGVVLLAFLGAAMILGFALGWTSLAPRMEKLREGADYREQMYANARPMARDYPLFGTGPGTFETVFQLYRITTSTYWPAQLHNDWLETRITFGLMGGALIAAAFVLACSRWFTPGVIHGGRRFMLLLWLALAGCLAHARYDFPFQIHSILFLFLIWCAILSIVTRRPVQTA